MTTHTIHPSPNHPTVDLPANLEGPRLPTTYLEPEERGAYLRPAEDAGYYDSLRDSIPTDLDHEPIDH